jgi:transcriptional regulator of acetoin/glycerol metabolism
MEVKANEILNLEYHHKRLVIKALNTALTINQAAALLGVSYNTLNRRMKQYNICLCTKTKRYTIKDKL